MTDHGAPTPHAPDGDPGGACPLCGACDPEPRPAGDRAWWDCPGCGLVFADRAELPDPAEERARYETHENDPADDGYRTFLGRLADPLAARLEPGAEGLDYGSGPGPTLSVMLEERGFPTSIWDPFFAPDPRPLARQWDFVTSSETVEHFHDPAREWARLFSLVRQGGVLGVMTEPFEEQRLDSWWYARDPTHVALYRPRTLEWIAARWEALLTRPARTVTIFEVGPRER
ncbi:MAG: class I SAM-dependent methyltransferase [Longimicrobiales bacterium]|nr:class I SAM-dependent methyltransferase [Longimicrobiales bacterium]